MNGDRQETVVIVDDDEAKRHTVVKILRKAGFHIMEAGSGEEGLRLALQKPAMVILDVKLPDMSGFEVCRRIKEDPLTASIPVLHISTTFVDIEDRVQGLEGGADAYLTDVLEPIELIATVKALLRTRKAEEAAHLSTQQWQVTFDAISDGVVLFDRDGRVLQSNITMEGILKVPRNQLSGQNIINLLPLPFGLDEFPHRLMIANSRREEAELQLGHRWFRVTFDPLRDLQGVVKGGLCIASDITDRRTLEKALRRRAEELAVADRRKDEFLAMLAHELRNPLAPIVNALETIRLGRGDESLIDETLSIAKRQVEHMARLLDDLLDVSRFTRGNVELRRQTLELTPILKQAIETSRPLIEAGDHQLSTSFPETAVYLEGDPTRLSQVVANLLNNAAKYTPPKGLISLSARQIEDQIIIAVRDNGIGLTAEMLVRVFDMFAQEARSIDRSQGGLGIGLTLVKSLVSLHGGTIEAASPGIGCGSEFTIKLPASATTIGDGRDEKENRTRLTEPVTESEPPFRPRRLLVVDDIKDSARSLARVLKLWGHDVQVAHDGPACIEIVLTQAETKPLDIILLDIGLPEMDGLQVAEYLRTTLGEHRPLTYALTGYGQEEDIARSMSAGFDGHLVKPVNLDHLRKLLFNEAVPSSRHHGNHE